MGGKIGDAESRIAMALWGENQTDLTDALQIFKASRLDIVILGVFGVPIVFFAEILYHDSSFIQDI
jgi:hypothetical protein